MGIQQKLKKLQLSKNRIFDITGKKLFMHEGKTITKIVISITANDQKHAEEISRKLGELKADIELPETKDKSVIDTARQLKEMGLVGVILED